MGTLDDFFAPAYDAVEKTARCLYCEKRSKDYPGTGEWTSANTWVCADHIQEQQNEQVEKQAEIDLAKARINAGTHNNADLTLIVNSGLAKFIYDDPDSNAPTGIEWISPSDQGEQVDW